MKTLYLPEWDGLIRYQVFDGDSPTYVYLTGLVVPSSSGLLPVAMHAALRQQRSILVDYFGCGFSESPERFDHTMDNHARTIAAILDAEHEQETLVIGHSMGGTVGFLLAEQRPDLVSKLIMAESNVAAGGGSGTRKIAAYTQDEFINTVFPQRQKRYRQQARHHTRMAAWQHGNRCLTDPRAEYLASVSLVNLDDDFMLRFLNDPTPMGFIYGQRTLDDLNGSTLPDVPDRDLLHQHGIVTAVIPNCGHIMMVDNLAGYVEAILACVDAL